MAKWILVALLALTTAHANQKSICGPADDRVLSDDPKIGRAVAKINTKGGCSITLISDSCAVTAGHCREVLFFAEFNVPLSNSEGEAQHPALEDIYEIDRRTLKYEHGMISDWAVFKLKPNTITGLLPGAVQGYYPVSFQRPKVGQTVRITGYGTDRDHPERNVVQQTNTGKIKKAGSLFSAKIEHTVDTMPGNSGSSIILENTGEIIGVHTNGGCTANGGTNFGYLISKKKKFREAITACIRE